MCLCACVHANVLTVPYVYNIHTYRYNFFFPFHFLFLFFAFSIVFSLFPFTYDVVLCCNTKHSIYSLLFLRAPLYVSVFVFLSCDWFNGHFYAVVAMMIPMDTMLNMHVRSILCLSHFSLSLKPCALTFLFYLLYCSFLHWTNVIIYWITEFVSASCWKSRIKIYYMYMYMYMYLYMQHKNVGFSADPNVAQSKPSVHLNACWLEWCVCSLLFGQLYELL